VTGVGALPLMPIFEHMAGAWSDAAANEYRWKGLALYGIDGTTLQLSGNYLDTYRRHLSPEAVTAPTKERRRISAKISRQLRLLRAHGITKKIIRTYRYQLTKRGRQLNAALQAARSSALNQSLQQTGQSLVLTQRISEVVDQ
jgi:hypothetical protein